MASYIDDGYTQAAVIAAESGIHDGLVCEFRPAVRREIERLNRVRDTPGWFDAVNTFLADHLVSWNLARNDGTPIAVSAENAERIHPRIFGELLAIILGNKAAAEADAKNSSAG